MRKIEYVFPVARVRARVSALRRFRAWILGQLAGLVASRNSVHPRDNSVCHLCEGECRGIQLVLYYSNS